jgi:phosphoglycolate phosphatase-like HAD superfamily hydrolase
MQDVSVYWDVDGVLLSYDRGLENVSDRQLRPYAKDLIQALESVGVTNYVWSRAGEGNARDAAKRVGLPEDRAFAKPEFETPDVIDYLPARPDLVIDDRPDETIMMYPHILVTPYKGGEDNNILDIIPQIRDHFDAIVQDIISEMRVSFRRKKSTPSKLKAQRKKYYRRHRAYYKRYKKRWKKTARVKRAQKMRKRFASRFKKKMGKYRMRVSM